MIIRYRYTCISYPTFGHAEDEFATNGADSMMRRGISTKKEIEKTERQTKKATVEHTLFEET